MDKPELLNNMRAGRARLNAALAQVTDEQMSQPGLNNQWSVKDLLAHLGFWERRVVNIYQALLHGEIPDPEADAVPIDILNQEIYNQNQQRSLQDVRQDEQRAYDDLLAVAENAPDADLFDGERFDWTEGQPFAAWISGNTYEHYDEHLPPLQDWIATLRP
jgi:uncharacterized protein (TIGR03083 family)